MKKPSFWDTAKKDLASKDKKLGKIIQSYPRDFLFTKSDPFYTLARSIIGQQISVSAAQAVWDRFEKKVKIVEPLVVKKIHFMSLKSCGLSKQKITYLKSLSDAFLKKTVQPEKWISLENEKIVEELTKIKGIGRWTAEMFLIFNLCRPDIFPADDLGLIKGICKCYNYKYPISKERAIKLSRKWKPWRSVATWYFWRSLDPIPVEY
ncbi:DNA-3-methyladenine glycosylase 2 family protein [Pelagibacteraceae bacterium]|nr:DNA-3-methyladenine glycosylase 2 family protein [Pelagibacteraceae bacterium]